MAKELTIKSECSTPRGKREARDLQDLLVLAGDGAILAASLGLSESTVYAWYRVGRISCIGALLVELSVFYGVYFSADLLRPGIDRGRWIGDARFNAARKGQKQFERKVTPGQTPSIFRILDVIDKRGGQCVATSNSTY